jgi:hypothetical protein
MGSKYKIPVTIFFLLCFSSSSLAGEKVYTDKDLKPDSSLYKASGEKVYTNKDLKPDSSLYEVSQVDPATGKVTNPEDASRKTTKLERIVTRARHAATRFFHEVKTNKSVQAAIIGILFLIWMACLLDIVRFEFRGNNKLIWFIAVTFIPVAGWILYLFIGRRQKKYRFIRDYE